MKRLGCIAGLAVMALWAIPAPAQQQNFPGGGTVTSPSSLTTFFDKYMGLSPNDFGAKGDTKFCFDGVVSGAPSTTFKSLSTATITNTALTNNVATYTISAAQPLATGSLVTVTGTSNGGGVYNVTNVPILNYATGATTFTVAITHANVGSAADSGTATSSCAAFTSTDVGKTIEILVGGLTSSLDVSTTIASVQSSSQVTLNANANTNASAKKFWYATDDTAALQSWVTAINNGIPTASGLQIHSGYLAGLYFTTKPLRFVNPLASTFLVGGVPVTLGISGGGYGIAEPWSLANANESLSLWGQGSYRTGIVAGSQFNWAFAGTAVNTGVVYLSGWNNPTLQNFAIMSGDYGIAYNTSTLTGTFGALYDDANGHVYTNGLAVENFHNTTSSLVADQKADGTFESNYTNTQIYNNDCAGLYGTSTAPSTRGLQFNNYTWGGNRGGGCVPAAQIVFQNGGANSGERGPIIIDNSVLDNESGSADIPSGTGLINIGASSQMDDSDEIKIENTRIQTNTANSFLVSVTAAAGLVRMSFANDNIVDTNATSSTNLFLNQDGTAGTTFNFFGGSLACYTAGSPTTCANGISNATGGTVYMYGTRQIGTVGTVGTGAGSVFAIVPSTTGWGGPGNFVASFFGSQGTTPTLTGTGACATTSTKLGGSSAGTFVCTGTTGASTVTITPGLTATNGWSCTASDVTHTLIGTQSATAATSCTMTFSSVTANDVITFTATNY